MSLKEKQITALKACLDGTRFSLDWLRYSFQTINKLCWRQCPRAVDLLGHEDDRQMICPLT